MRIVLDTNVLISAFLWQGRPKEIFSLAEKGIVQISVTKEIVQEFEAVLSYPKFQARFTRINKSPSEIIDEFLEIAKYYPSARFSKTQIPADPPPRFEC